MSEKCNPVKACLKGGGEGVITGGLYGAITGKTAPAALVGASIGALTGCAGGVYSNLYASTEPKSESKSEQPRNIIGPPRFQDIISSEPKIYSYLVNNNISHNDIKLTMENKTTINTIKNQFTTIQIQQNNLNIIQTRDGYINTLNEAKNMFSNIGMLDSPIFNTISKTGILAMDMAVLSERHINFVSKFIETGSFISLFEPISLIASIASGVIGLFSGRKSSDQLAGFRELIRSLAHHIDRHMEGLHNHLDAIHGSINQIAGMVNICIQNQEKIYKLQIETFQLINKTFNILNNRLTDIFSSAQNSLEQIHCDIQYLIEIGELREIKDCRKELLNNIDTIKSLNIMQIQNPLNSRIPVLEEKVSNLKTMINLLCSKEWNGFNEYDRIKNNHRQCSEYIIRHSKSGDMCFAFLAEKIEKIMNISLSNNQVNKDILFPNVLLTELISNFISISKLGSVKAYNYSDILNSINSKADNVIKFIEYIKSIEVRLFTKLVVKHKTILNNIQAEICQIYVHKKENASQNNLSIKQFFGDSLNGYLYELDENYLLTKLIGYLIGKEGPRLSNSEEILRQKFVFSEGAKLVEYIWDLSAGSYDSERRQGFDIDCGLDHIIGKISGGELVHMNISTRGNMPGHANGRVAISMNYYNILTGKTRQNGYDSYTHYTVPDRPLQIGYKTMLNYHNLDHPHSNTVPQAWVNSHIYDTNNGDYLVLFSPGTGEVAIKKISDDKWLDCDNNSTPAVMTVSYHGRNCITQHNGPFQTCLTNIIDSNLMIHIFDWKSNPDKVMMRREIFDIQHCKWCDKKSRSYLYHEELEFCKKSLTSPNQLFIQNIKPYTTTPYFFGDYVIGYVVSGDNLKIEICYEYFGWRFYVQEFDIKIQSVNQIKSELLTINNKKKLIVVISAKISDDTNKLIFLVTEEYKWTEFELTEFELRDINKIADLQAMRVVTTNLGTKPYIIISLLNNDFISQLYRFDPQTKRVIQLENGPKILESDRINNVRQKFPGYYPFRNFELNVTNINNMITLYFSYTRLWWNHNCNRRDLTIIPYKLSPIIKTDATYQLTENYSNIDLVMSMLNCQILANQRLMESTILIENNENDDDIKTRISLNIRLLKTYQIPNNQPDMTNIINENFIEIDRIMNAFDRSSLTRLRHLIDNIDMIFKLYVENYNISENVGRLIKDMYDLTKKME